MKMIPPDPIQSTRRAVHAGESRSGPGHRVQNPAGSQKDKLLLIAMCKGISQVDEILVIRPIPTTNLSLTPVCAAGSNSSFETGDPEPSEILAEASHVCVTAVDHPPLRYTRDQQGA